MSSVWSRVGRGSTTVVRPARRRARRAGRADFTCALATGSCVVDRAAARRPRARPAGGRPCVSTETPMRRSGSAIRSIGRRDRDSSPTSSKRPSCPARIPASSRISVPALPQSIGSPGARSPRRPAPRTTSVVSPSSTTSTPSARTAASVDSVSPERPQPSTRTSPSQRAPTSSARCEIDLSPGTRTWPVSAAAGATFTRPGCSRRRPSTPAPRAPRRRAPPARARSRAASACRRARARGGAARSPRC